MADTFPPARPGGLTHFDLTLIFRCAVELAEAAASAPRSEWADVPADIEGRRSPHFRRWIERHDRVQRIGQESERLKRSLGASGPLQFHEAAGNASPAWESYDRRFTDAAHDRGVRLALEKLATAAIDLSGFATWRELQWGMRYTGVRLLTQGLAQLWDGMSDRERSEVRDRLRRTSRDVGWPSDPANPTPYDGPDEILPQDQYRIVTNYISCYLEYPKDAERDSSLRTLERQEWFLRRAGVGQLAEAAEDAAEAVSALGRGEYDSPTEYGGLYLRAFWPLACLRRAGEVAPREQWSDDAAEQRRLLAGAADVLLRLLEGEPHAAQTEDADRALETFTRATRRLREIAGSPGVTALETHSGVPPAGTPTERLAVPKPNDHPSLALLRVYTDGVSDDRMSEASQVLANNKLTANEKLTRIDDLIRLPPTASAEQLGEMLGVTKQAVLKTDWWARNRKGEKDGEIDRRRAVHRRRAKELESPLPEEADEGR